jgi:hypothetical protein
MPDETSSPKVDEAADKVEGKAALIAPPQKVADRPHWITMCLGISPLLVAIVSVGIALQSLSTNRQAMKVAQRAYLTYQVTVTNGSELVEDIRADKDSFFLNYQITVVNMGNTPADSIKPNIAVKLDPDRTPMMVTFPNQVAFELGPKESRILTGQALFGRVRHVRGFPGLATGFTGQIDYKDAFEESHMKQVCYEFVVLGDSGSGGVCGTVLQFLQIE